LPSLSRPAELVKDLPPICWRWDRQQQHPQLRLVVHLMAWSSTNSFFYRLFGSPRQMAEIWFVMMNVKDFLTR
jgi:hypothetical protein